MGDRAEVEDGRGAVIAVPLVAVTYRIYRVLRRRHAVGNGEDGGHDARERRSADPGPIGPVDRGVRHCVPSRDGSTVESEHMHGDQTGGGRTDGVVRPAN
jgi:hypothetical protein